MPKKPKANSLIEISKISGIYLTMRCFDSQSANDMIYMEPNEKLQKIIIKFMWEVIYAYFYNRDGSHYLVLVVYDLFELIIEASHWTKDYLIFDIHTQHTSLCSMNAIFICVIVLV